MTNHVDIPIELNDWATTASPHNSVLSPWAETERRNNVEIGDMRDEIERRRGRVARMDAVAMMVAAFVAVAGALALGLLNAP